MAGSRDGYDVCNDTIFVQGLPEDTTDEQLAEYFGQIGIIKYDKKNECKKIWIYKDKATGKGKGEATITYDDPPTATSAIDWFNSKEFRGSKLKIELAQRKAAPAYGRGGGRGGGGGGRGFGNRGGGFDRGGGGYGGFRGERGPYDRGGGGEGRGGGRPGGGGGPGGRPGDWTCPSCNNSNFAYRQECNRCKTQKPHGGGGGGGSSTSGSHEYGGGSGRDRHDQRHDLQHGRHERHDRHGGSSGGSDRHSDGRSFSRAQLVSRAQKLYRP